MVANAHEAPNEDSPSQTPAPSSAALVVVGDRYEKAGHGHGAGRKKFDLDHVRTLGMMGASRREMASQLRCSEETIDKRLASKDSKFYAAFHEGLTNLTLRLRHRQIQAAMAGDTKMLIWLGMQLMQQKNITAGTLEQKGKVEHRITFTIKQGADAEGNPVAEIERISPLGIARDGEIGVARRATFAPVNGNGNHATIMEDDPDA